MYVCEKRESEGGEGVSEEEEDEREGCGVKGSKSAGEDGKCPNAALRRPENVTAAIAEIDSGVAQAQTRAPYLYPARSSLGVNFSARSSSAFYVLLYIPCQSPPSNELQNLQRKQSRCSHVDPARPFSHALA